MKRPRFTLEKRNALEEGQKRGCCRSTGSGIVALRRSWREIFLWKTGIGTKKEKRSKRERKAGVSFHRSHNHNPTHEKLTKFREHLPQSR